VTFRVRGWDLSGSKEEARGRATRALLDAGATRLEALVGGHVASFGDVCFQTDTRLQHELLRPDGKRYHRESIARARRRLRDNGFITSTRIFTNDPIPGAKYNRGCSTRGTTLKAFNWRRLQLKNPFSRAARRELRIKQAQAARAAGELVRAPARPPAPEVQREPGPRYSSPAHTPAAPPMDPDMAAAIETARSAHEQRQQRAAAARVGQVPAGAAAPERPPPD
jgi:hypothetical protein